MNGGMTKVKIQAKRIDVRFFREGLRFLEKQGRHKMGLKLGNSYRFYQTKFHRNVIRGGLWNLYI